MSLQEACTLRHSPCPVHSESNSHDAPVFGGVQAHAPTRSSPQEGVPSSLHAHNGEHLLVTIHFPLEQKPP